jgi:hypothetical protein
MDHPRTRGRGGWEGWVILGDDDFGSWVATLLGVREQQGMRSESL